MAQSLRYRVSDVGLLPNHVAGATSRALGINESNAIVGVTTGPEGELVGFIRLTTNNLGEFDDRQQMFDLSAVADLADESSASDINELGQVAGRAGPGAAGAAIVWQAHLYDPNGSSDMQTISIPLLASGSFNDAFAINDESPAIVVGCGDTSITGCFLSITKRGFRATLSSPVSVTVLGSHLSPGSSQANGINTAATRVICGISQDCGAASATDCEASGYPPGDITIEPTFWQGSGTAASTLDTLDVDVSEDARDVNNAGKIVGWVRILDGQTCLAVPVIWTSTGANATQLPLLASNHNGQAEAINNITNAQIVGWDVIDGVAVLWELSGSAYVATDLNDLSFGGDPGYGIFILEEAHDITDDGWIVGKGVNADGNTRGFLLSPLESCPADIFPIDNPDGIVGAGDLAQVLATYGTPGCSGRIPCTSDLIVDGTVDDDDRDYLRFDAYGSCEEGFGGGGEGDFSNDDNDPFVALFMEALETVGFSSVEEYFSWLDTASDEEDLAVVLILQSILNNSN